MASMGQHMTVLDCSMLGTTIITITITTIITIITLTITIAITTIIGSTPHEYPPGGLMQRFRKE